MCVRRTVADGRSLHDFCEVNDWVKKRRGGEGRRETEDFTVVYFYAIAVAHFTAEFFMSLGDVNWTRPKKRLAPDDFRYEQLEHDHNQKFYHTRIKLGKQKGKRGMI